jgi:hypothetical protein|tara:strand:+ start:75 stop:578 length:504 start_codon:yes stop_codon:yes gene_type:complete
MNLSEFSRLLLDHPDHGMTLALPDSSTAPAHFHITEVGAISKAFLDCGGKRHSEQTCVLQVWVADDYGHRIQAGKLARILGAASDLFGSQDVPVEFEHEAPVLTRLPIESIETDEQMITFHLSLKKADCLAKDICLQKRDFSLPNIPEKNFPSKNLTGAIQIFNFKK